MKSQIFFFFALISVISCTAISAYTWTADDTTKDPVTKGTQFILGATVCADKKINLQIKDLGFTDGDANEEFQLIADVLIGTSTTAKNLTCDKYTVTGDESNKATISCTLPAGNDFYKADEVNVTVTLNSAKVGDKSITLATKPSVIVSTACGDEPASTTTSSTTTQSSTTGNNESSTTGGNPPEDGSDDNSKILAFSALIALGLFLF